MSTSARKKFHNYKNRYGEAFTSGLSTHLFFAQFVFPTFFQQFVNWPTMSIRTLKFAMRIVNSSDSLLILCGPNKEDSAAPKVNFDLNNLYVIRKSSSS
uniref:Uncharacterized protein n=1 Tax=Meloidogyne enterolobii TaxID=390850 RepID=A0A6V7V4Q8_MELEN|nr:unnamed protein product [Meloidogyne enterolobii]